MRLKDQVVIVTGVSHPGQVGYGLAAAFAREGAHLAISTRNAERALTMGPPQAHKDRKSYSLSPQE